MSPLPGNSSLVIYSKLEPGWEALLLRTHVASSPSSHHRSTESGGQGRRSQKEGGQKSRWEERSRTKRDQDEAMWPGCSQRLSRGPGRCRQGGGPSDPARGGRATILCARGWGGHCPSYCPDKGQPRARHLDTHPADSLPHSPQLAGADLAELERGPERSVAREVTAAISNGSAVLPGGQQCQCRGEEEAGCCTRWTTKLWRPSESQADPRFWGHMLSSTTAANPGCTGGQCT